MLAQNSELSLINKDAPCNALCNALCVMHCVSCTRFGAVPHRQGRRHGGRQQHRPALQGTHCVTLYVTHCVTHYVSHYVMQYALSSFLPMKTSYAVAASVTYGCSLDHMQLQPRLHTLAAPIAYGCSLDHISRTAAASITYRVQLQP